MNYRPSIPLWQDEEQEARLRTRKQAEAFFQTVTVVCAMLGACALVAATLYGWLCL